MNEALKELYQYGYSSGGECFLPIEKMSYFIELCNSNDVVIIAVEFFKLDCGKIEPYEKLIGFDATSIYEPTIDRHVNCMKCNAFIMDCYLKSKERVSGLHFSAVIEHESSL